jgi:hypothetical protein
VPNLFLDDVVCDGDLADSYVIVRNTGKFAAGGFQQTSVTSIPVFGVVTAASLKDIEMVPEGDRVREMRAFYARQPLYVTRDNPQDGTGTSDVLQWHGQNYRILTVGDYSNRGYWKAIAARTSGV